jgi:hypothetical protein
MVKSFDDKKQTKNIESKKPKEKIPVIRVLQKLVQIKSMVVCIVRSSFLKILLCFETLLKIIRY